MVRLCVPVGLTFAHLVLSGCSYRQQVDLARWREYRSAPGSTTAEEFSRTAITRSSSVHARLPQTTISRAKDGRDEVQLVGTVGQSPRTIVDNEPKHLRPWPKRGTPEFEQLQAEEIEQENRIKSAIHGICRGC